jgi:membrane protease YdiL (CAAX protease family)
MLRIHLAALLALLFLVLLTPSGRLQFLALELPARRSQLIGTFLLWGVLAVCIFYPTVSADDAAAIEPSEVWFPSLFIGHALMGSFLFVWWRLRPPQPLAQFLRIEHVTAQDVRLGLRVGAIGWALTIAVTATVGILVGDAGTVHPSELPSMMLWLAGLPLSDKLIIIAVAMTVEEAFFRGFLQPRVGWLLSSVLFALGHASYGLPMLLVSVFTISLVIGWSMRRTGRLLPCIIAHGLFDAVQLLIVIPWAINTVQEGAL